MNEHHYTAQQAQQRVNASPKLRPYYAEICEYGFENLQEHIDWVCTASEDEIIDAMLVLTDWE